jgi:hypothetical protein
MLTWLENHLIVLGLLAIVAGFGLGALLPRVLRKAGRITDSRRRPAVSPAATGSSTTGAGSVRPRYQARTW